MSDFEKNCFVLSPIGDRDSDVRRHADNVLKLLIEPAMKNLGISTERSDMIHEPGLITSQIIERIAKSSIVIADLTGSNPNVFYELGIRHAMRLPVIHLIEHGSRIPFDISQYRAVEYDLKSPKFVDDSVTELGAQVEYVLKNPKQILNPVTMAIPDGKRDTLEKKQLTNLKDRAERYYSPLFYLLQRVSIDKQDLIIKIIDQHLKLSLLSGPETNQVITDYIAIVDKMDTNNLVSAKREAADFLSQLSRTSLKEYNEILKKIHLETKDTPFKEFVPNLVGLNQLISALRK